MSIQTICTKLEEILCFLQPYMAFINCHVVNYLTEDLWKSHIPKKVRDSIHTDSDIVAAAMALLSKNDCTRNRGALGEFISGIEKYHPENFTEVFGQEVLLNQLKRASRDNISIKEFMSEKKRHEVEIAAEFVYNLTNLRKHDNSVYIVDAGDGKGYLASRLALQYNFKVLGIDAIESNTEGAKKRNTRLERAWNGLTQRASLIKEGKVPPRRGKKSKREEVSTSEKQKFDNYKAISEFIVPELDLAKLLEEHFLDAENPEICLCGLHTCGNLAPTCLKLFCIQESIKILFNVGCCYHLLNEEFSKDDLYVNHAMVNRNSESSFPMSSFLRKKSFRLGRNARMLASQSIHRTRSSKELANKSLFYRALLEVMIKESLPELDTSVQIGKIKKFESFQEYVEKCSQKLSRLGFTLSIPNDCNSWVELHSHEAKLLDLFYLIRMSFAPVIETLILLDRLLFLKENNFNESYIVPLFDPVISPRRFAIISLK